MLAQSRSRTTPRLHPEHHRVQTHVSPPEHLVAWTGLPLSGPPAQHAGQRHIYNTEGETERHIYTLAAEFDPAFAALIEDLESSGKLSETLVLACGEFGRTPGPLSNTRLGRDHY